MGDYMVQAIGKEFKAGLYIRISREDGDKGTSDSVINQEKLLKNFIDEKEGIIFGDCYIDEDYTGTNFNRPSFQRMMNDLKQDKINCIVIKDLSRFGRNFIESSRYIEEILPNLNCRFISVLDNVDSYENPDINTDLLLRLKNLIHDNNSQEISKKVRAVKDMQRREGKYISPFAPYGYVKDPNNNYILIIDKEAAHNVRNIFNWYLDGMGVVRITEKLNRLGILSLSEYKRKMGRSTGLKSKTNSWYPNVVRHMLTNKAYIGALDQKRITTRNYKDRKIIRLEEKDHIIVYDTHEPIIERYKFDRVQELLKQKGARTSPKRQKLYLFSGFMRCVDCNSSMIRNDSLVKDKRYVYYKCRAYNQRGKVICSSSHSVREELIYSAVLDSINSQISNLIDIKNTIETYNKVKKENKVADNLIKLIAKNEKKIKEIDSLKMSLYADYKKDVFTENEFLNMKKSYSNDIKSIEKDILILKEELKIENDVKRGRTPWIEDIIKHGKIITLERNLIIRLVDKIYVTADKDISVKFKNQAIYDGIAENLYSINPKQVGGNYANILS